MSNYFDTRENIFNNYYEILEVNEDTSIIEIRKNYLKLAKKYHPDQGGNSEMFELISQAYECLSKPEFRKNYDLEYNNMKCGMNDSIDDGILNDKQNFNNLKYEFEDFKKKNTKIFSQEELSNMYNDLFKKTTICKDVCFKNDDFLNKILDIKTEREMNEIEITDEYYKNIIEKNNLNVSELYEFMKTENNQQLINKPIYSYELTQNNISSSYSSFLEDKDDLSLQNNDFTSNFESYNNKKNFDINKFSEWKNNQNINKKLTEEDIHNFLKDRNDMELKIANEIENNFKDYKKKTDIEKFMKLENKINNDDLFLTK
jgi:curved DNA-binding protein CbpA